MITVLQIPTTSLHAHPANPRRDLGDLTELADSIRAHGIQQALVAVPHCDHPDATADTCVIRVKTDDGTTWCSLHRQAGVLRVVIGHRRLAAARQAGLPDVPTIITTGLTPADQLELMLVENVQRADLTPLEEAGGYQGLLDLGVEVAMIARKTGRARTTVKRRLDLLALPDEARVKIDARQASLEDAAKALAYADQPDVFAQLTEALGTTNFEWRLERTQRDAAERTKQAKVAEKLIRRGLIELDSDADPQREDWTSLDCLQSADVGGRKDFGEATHFRRHLAGWINLYRATTDAERDKHGKSDAAKARHAARVEAARQAEAEIIAECELADELRATWIRGLLARKTLPAEQRQLIVTVAAGMLLTGDLRLDSWDTKERLGALVGVEDGHAWLDTYTGPSEALLLAAIHLKHTLSRWAKPDWAKAHQKLGLVDLYRLLEALGYPVSDVERARIWPTADEAVA